MGKLFNLARMTTATTGTGTITLGSAISGFLTFAQAGVSNGDVVDYAVKDGNNSEIGTGTYSSSGTALTRAVTNSTNNNAAINLSGTAEVFISPRAQTLDIERNRQNFHLSIVDMSKLSASYRRLINLFATGFKATDDAANGISTGSSLNYAVNSSSGFVAPSPTTTQIQISPFGSDAGQGAALTIVDRTTAITNGRVVSAVGIFSTSARTISLKIFQVTNTTDGAFVFNQSVSHPGGGWVDFNLATQYAVPGSGTFYLAAGMQNGTLSFTASLASRLSFVGDVTGAQTGGISGAGIAFPMRYNYVTGVANMTLVTTAQTADASVGIGRIQIIYDDAAELIPGTDFTIEASCNGGVNWTAAGAYTVATTNGPDGHKVIETDDITCTAGTSFELRAKTLTSKNMPTYGLSLEVH